MCKTKMKKIIIASIIKMTLIVVLTIIILKII